MRICLLSKGGKMKLFILLFFIMPVLVFSQYKVDPAHTSISFSVKHMVIATVKGSFSKFEGAITYDEKDLSKWSVKGKIFADSIDTNNSDRDKHLKSPDFFDVKKYPEITFESKNFRKDGDGYISKGIFTMHGVSKEIEIPFKILGKIKDPWGNERIGVEASLKINRQDFGISWNNTLDNGGLIVGNEVQIELSAEFVK